MKAIYAAAVMVLAATTAFAMTPPAVQDSVRYQVSPVMSDAGAIAVDVRMTFRGEADGETLLMLPDDWGGEADLWKAISDLRAEGGTLRDGAQPQYKLVSHAPNAPVTVRYRLTQEVPGDPQAQNGNDYRVIIRPSYLHLLGNAAFIEPGDGEGRPASVAFEGFAPGWTVASDLQHNSPITVHDVIESVTVAGDFTVVTPSRGAKGVRVAIRGAFAFTPQAVADQIGDILAAQRTFWGAGDEPFLVTILPLASTDPGRISLGGTGRGDAFSFYATSNADGAKLARVLAHEAQHTWTPRRIGSMESRTQEPADYWISEGFTDFYAQRLLVRAGLWTPKDFADDLNEILLAYAFSPERASPNSRIVEAFWTNPAVQKLPYQRGMLIAYVLDGQVRAANAGRRDFDDVMLGMQAAVRASPGQPIPVRTGLRTQAARHGLRIDPLLAEHIDGGAPILLPRDQFAPCGTVETMRLGAFHRGFDIEKTLASNNVITGVDPVAPAYAAGLRDGMVLIRREGGRIGDPTQEIGYRVKDGETERVIRYLPSAPGPTFETQRFVLAADLSGPALAACRARLSGEG